MFKWIRYRMGSLLLDMGGLAVDRIESDAFGGRVTADETASACPACGVFSASVKALVCTRPRDSLYGTRGLRLIWHKRRRRCRERLCPRASFTESLPAVRARSRLTTRLRTELGYAIAEQGRVVSESAAHYSVDWSIVHDAFVARVKAPLPPVRVLGIDETLTAIRGEPHRTCADHRGLSRQRRTPADLRSPTLRVPAPAGPHRCALPRSRRCAGPGRGCG